MDGRELREQRGTVVRTVNHHHTVLYSNIALLLKYLGAARDPLLWSDRETTNVSTPCVQVLGGSCNSSINSNLLFRIRCEEEIQLMEVQRAALLTFLREKELECERLRAQGNIYRVEIESLLPSMRLLCSEVSLSHPSDGEVFLLSRLTHRKSMDPITGTTTTEAPLSTLASAAAALEEKIQYVENSILKKNDRTIAASKMQDHVLQILRRELKKEQMILQQDMASLLVAEVWALEAEEEKSRIMLELEEMKSLEMCENSSFTLLTFYNTAITERATAVTEKRNEMRRLLAQRNQSIILSTRKENNNDNNSNDNKNKNGGIGTGEGKSDNSDEKSQKNTHNVELIADTHELQETVKQLLAVHESLLILNAHTVNLADDMDEIESVVTELRNDPSWIPALADTNVEVELWRISLLQKAYDNAVDLLQQAHGDFTASVAADILTKVKYLCIINNIFACRPAVLASAVMDSRTKWQGVHHMLPAVKKAMLVLRRSK